MQNLQQVQRSESALSQFEITKGIYTSGILKTLKIKPTAKLVLIGISQHYPQIFPSLKFLAEQLGISETSVKNSIKELRNAGLIVYSLDRVNHYRFTQKFFEMINITYESGKKCLSGRQNPPTNKQKQKNNKENEFKKIELPKEDKLPKYHHNTHITGMNYPKWKPTEQKKESPLDLNKEQSIEFLNNLPCRMQSSYFAAELRKKWGIK